MSPPRHILLVRTDHLGDMLLTLPMARALKAARPDCRITVLASAANAVAAEHQADVDAVVVDACEAKGSGLRGLRTLVGQIRDLACDAAVIVHPTPRLALAVWLAGVPIRIGTAYRAYSFLFNQRVRQHRRRPPQRHESEYNVELLAPLGVEMKGGTTDGGPSVDAMLWQVEAESEAAVGRILESLGVAARAILVALHPGSAGNAMNWAAAQYGALGKRLVEAGCTVVVTGGPHEAKLTAEVTAAIGAGGVDLGGRFTLPQLAALLKRCAVYVGSSTGPTHVAAAVGTPVVALYSPLYSQSPVRWRPLGAKVEVLQPAVDLVCPKCLGPACPYYHCMQRHLTVDRVEQAVRRVLPGLAAPERIQPQ